jgi:hypothetical protein
MVDFLYDLDPRGRRNSVATQLPAFVIVVPSIEFVSAREGIAFGDLNGGYLEIVLCLSRCVCAKE